MSPLTFAEINILVVDDEEIIRTLLGDFLEVLGFTNHRLAGDGREAMELLRADPPDCLLSDVLMPEMGLIDMLPLIRSDHPEMSVIAMSGYSDSDSALELARMGANDFLGKPVDLDELERALRWPLARRAILDAAERADPESPCDRVEPVLFDQAKQCGARLFRHSARVARLAQTLDTGLDPATRTDLILAALTHEIGAGRRIDLFAEQSRRLGMNEIAMMRGHYPLTARAVARRLGRPAIEPMIARHSVASADDPPGTTCLGLLNIVDGCLSDRGDRPALGVDRVRDILDDRYTPTDPVCLDRLLAQWSIIESLYTQ